MGHVRVSFEGGGGSVPALVRARPVGPECPSRTYDGGMFVDEARVSVAAGRGGDGAVSFHREKYQPRGGPDGGNGGGGGDVILEAVSHQNTLLPLRYHTEFRATRGEHGGPGNRTGAEGGELLVQVPPGTSAVDEATGEVIGEVLGEGDRLLLARGGRGQAQGVIVEFQRPW